MAYLELVQHTGGEVRNEELPDPVAGTRPHRMSASVPAVEVAHHAHPLCIWCPYGKQDARDTVHRVLVGAQEAVGMPVLALAEQVQVEVRELGQIGIGIVGDVLVVL